jgi:asparaginyl-tRNA synthetase
MSEKRNMINDILNGQYEGPQVSIKGWVYNIINENGNISWVIRDRTGYINVYLPKQELSSELYGKASTTERESVVGIDGTVFLQDKKTQIKLSSLEVLSPSKGYPAQEEISSKTKYRYLQIRNPKKRATIIIANTTRDAIREYLKKEGFTEISAPTINMMAAEDSSTLFDLRYFDDPAHLSQSTRSYLELALPTFEKVFSIAPTFRKEKGNPLKHLSEFTTIEVQQAFADSNEMIRLLEGLFSHTIEVIKGVNSEELKVLGRNPSTLYVKTPFRRFTYDEAKVIIKKAKIVEKERDKSEVDWRKGFTSHEEDILSESALDPFIITDFPVEARWIFYKTNSEKPDRTKSFDLIAPISGEVATGGDIITDYDSFLQRIAEYDLSRSSHQWYLDFMKFGNVDHAGFGTGLERLLMFPTGLTDIKEIPQLPRYYGAFPEP